MLDEGGIKSECFDEEERESRGKRKGNANERRRNGKKDERRREKREMTEGERETGGEKTEKTRGDDNGVGWLIRRGEFLKEG